MTIVVFHQHLDVCEQCRDNPFALCVIGDRLLREAAEAISERPVPTVVDDVNE
jgi:hypothetical protein